MSVPYHFHPDAEQELRAAVEYLEDDEVTIVAVMHLDRKPGYWKRRLKKR